MQTGVLSEMRSTPGGASPTLEQRQRIDEMTREAWKLRTTDTQSANRIATEAREFAIACGYTLGRARAARTLSMAAVDIEGLQSTLRLAEEAKELFDEVGDDSGRAGARDFLAMLCEFLGDHSTGMQHALDALDIARRIGHAKRQGYALSSVGGLLAATGDVETAIERFHEGLELFERIGNTDGVARLCSRLSSVLSSLERYDEALAYAERCRGAAESTTSRFAKASALLALAGLHVKMGNPEEAEPLYRAVIDSFENPVRQSLGAGVYVKLGRLLLERGDHQEAAHLLVTALENLRTIDMGLADEASANEALADLREREGDLAGALGHLREAMRLRERLAQRDVGNKVMQIQIRSEIEAAKKDAEIHKLRFVELHAMQTQLVEAEKSALLGTLAAGTAHELNTPLGVLQSNLEASATAAAQLAAAGNTLGDVPARARRLLDILKASRSSSEAALQRIGAITESFKRFSQLDQAEKRAFDVREGLEAALALLEPSIRAEIRIERQLGDAPHVLGWPRELNHAFMTVLLNAVDAIDGSGHVRASVATDGDAVVVAVSDTGRGMTSKQLQHLFDVGWSERGGRTKMKLGLSAAHATVSRHGGRLDVASVVGEGTTFTFRLPAHPL